MRIELQVNTSQPKRPPPPALALPKEKLAGMAKGLAEGPLKETLERMAARKK